MKTAKFETAIINDEVVDRDVQAEQEIRWWFDAEMQRIGVWKDSIKIRKSSVETLEGTQITFTHCGMEAVMVSGSWYTTATLTKDIDCYTGKR